MKHATSAASLVTTLATAGRTEVWVRKSQNARNAIRGAAPLKSGARNAVRNIGIVLKRVTVPLPKRKVTYVKYR
jgi:hypothetical protein